MTSRSLTVAIPTLGRTEPLRKCLESLSDQTKYIDEVLIGDQNPDDTAKRAVSDIESNLPITILNRSQVEYTPQTRNVLLRHTSSDVICYLDDDVEVSDGWAEALLAGYDHPTRPVAVGGPAISVTPDGDPVNEFLRVSENQNRLNKYGEYSTAWDRWVPPSPVPTDLLSGGNMSYTVESLEAVGGFDSAYDNPQRGEDIIAAVKLYQNGSTLLYHPDALVYHYDAPAGGSNESFAGNNDYRYWSGRFAIRLRWHYFRDQFWISLPRLLLSGDNASVWKLIGVAIRDRNKAPHAQLRGYIDGLRYETDLFHKNTVD